MFNSSCPHSFPYFPQMLVTKLKSLVTFWLFIKKIWRAFSKFIFGRASSFSVPISDQVRRPKKPNWISADTEKKRIGKLPLFCPDWTNLPNLPKSAQNCPNDQNYPNDPPWPLRPYVTHSALLITSHKLLRIAILNMIYGTIIDSSYPSLRPKVAEYTKVPYQPYF